MRKMKTTADHPTPPSAPSKQSVSQSTNFWAMATNLSWQLALVVIIPIFGGAKLDDWFGTKPVLTVIGFVLASAGMAIVVWRMMKLMSPQDTADTEEKDV